MKEKDFLKVLRFGRKLGIKINILKENRNDRLGEIDIYGKEINMFFGSRKRKNWKSRCYLLAHEIGHFINTKYRETPEERRNYQKILKDFSDYVDGKKEKFSKKDLNKIIQDELLANELGFLILELLGIKYSNYYITLEGLLEEWVYNYQYKFRKVPTKKILEANYKKTVNLLKKNKK